jgi:hypothetical protein
MIDARGRLRRLEDDDGVDGVVVVEEQLHALVVLRREGCGAGIGEGVGERSRKRPTA